MVAQSYVDGSIQDYLGKLASAEPEPGGGSVAALVGALGAALVTMVADLTLGKEKYAAVQDQIADVKTKAEELRHLLQDLVTLDAEAYRVVAGAMKMPRGSEEEKSMRDAALQEALVGAAKVPLQIAEAALEVAKLSLPAAESGNSNAVTDAGIAAILAEAAAQSAALNVKINLAWISDTEFNETTWSRVQSILSETASLRECVLALTYSKV
jgi:glutamate formiminotransferase/formiminotetrahydrofolate cyclodeaminase